MMRLNQMKIGDVFIARGDGKTYRIAAWYKDRAPPDTAACPLVDPVDGGPRTMFAGCAEGTLQGVRLKDP